MPLPILTPEYIAQLEQGDDRARWQLDAIGMRFYEDLERAMLALENRQRLEKQNAPAGEAEARQVELFG